MQDAMSSGFAELVESRDGVTGGHVKNTGIYFDAFIRALKDEPRYKNDITDDFIKNTVRSAPLHDIGKIGIPDTIINKPSKLTDEEYRVIKEHPLTGAQILSEIKSVPDLIYGAKYHHERYDGKGYPCGIKGKDLPEIAAIIAVADAYDAMTSNRSYRKLLSQDIVRSEIEKGLGTQFHPKWGKIMLDLIDKDTEYKMHQ